MKIIKYFKRETSLGKLEMAALPTLTPRLDEETARTAALQMSEKSRKFHYVYGHSKYNEAKQKIGTVFYNPIKLSRRQYQWLADFVREEFNISVSDYFVYAVHPS